MRELLRRLRFLLRRAEFQRELEEEMAHHLAMLEESGRSPAAARRQLGNLTSLREESQSMWTFTWIEQTAQDLRYALRTIGANPLFTATAALSLALGIGANTALYSFMDSLLLRSLPVPQPESLAVLNWHAPPHSGHDFVMKAMSGETWGDDKTAGEMAGIFPYPAFELMHKEAGDIFSSVFAYYPTRRVNLMVKNQAEQTSGEYVSGDYFRGLALTPAAGRLIVPDDDRPGAPAVAVLSYACSQKRFGDAASAPGQAIRINNVPFTVAGVAPPEFFGVDPAAAPDFYIPVHTNVLLQNRALDDFGKRYFEKNYYWIEIMGRLRPGVGRTKAQAALGPLFHQWVETTAANDRERANVPDLTLLEGATGLDTLRRRYSKPLYVLLAMVALILAIACANIANLLLARAAARRREMAVRLSMGAGRWRVIRQLLTESLLLASIGGILGVAFAMWGIRFLTLLLSSGNPDFTLHPDLNWHVLGAALGLSLLTGLLFGLAPAVQSTRVEVIPALKESQSSALGSRKSFRGIGLSQALVVSQIGISLLMLVAAGLFVRTLSNLQSIQLGFNREDLLLFQTNARQAGHQDPEIITFYSDLQKRFAAIPGVRSASVSHSPLLGQGTWGSPVVPVGQERKGSSSVLQTGPDFFATMQIPILRGRAFDDRDQPGSSPVAVVSEAYVRKYFADRNPLGQHIVVSRRPPLGNRDVEIVGVAGNARYGAIKGEFRDIVYLPFHQGSYVPVDEMTFALRTSGDPFQYANTVRAIVRQADARVPVTNIQTQAAQVDHMMNQEIIFARLCTTFAVLALVIACVGLYGTMAYTVARRTGEIGIRMALGAQRGSVVWMVLRQALALAAVGIAVGVPTALSISRLVESFLFGVKPNSPTAVMVAILILLTAVLVAGYVPARKASRIDPMIAVRNE